MRLRTLTAGLTLLGTALAVSPAPAQAAVQGHGDARHDVVRDDAGTDRPAPDNRTADIRRLRVNHTGAALSTTLVLDTIAKDHWGVIWQVKTPEQGRWTVQVLKFGQTKDFTLHHRGTTVACADMTKQVTRSTGTVHVVVPRSCLDDPAWVRVGGGAFASSSDGMKQFADDARLDGEVHQAGLVLGPRLAAG